MTAGENKSIEMSFRWKFDWGDGNSTYDIELSGPCTVGQMVELILEHSLKTGEWGDVTIGSSLRSDVFLFSYSCNRITEKVPVWAERYKKGNLEEYRSKLVVAATATGGYGNTSYVIKVEPTE